MRSFFLLLLFFFIGFSILPAVYSFTIGAAPTSLSYDNVLRDSEINDIVYLFNENNFSVFYLTNNTHGFVHLYEENVDISTFIIPPLSKVPVKINFSIPDDIRNGVYEDVLLFTFTPIQNNDISSFALQSGIGIRATFTITDQQNIHYNLTQAFVTDTEKDTHLPLTVTFINDGNVFVELEFDATILTHFNSSAIKNNYQIGLNPGQEQTQNYYLNTTQLSEGKYTLLLTSSLSEEPSLTYHRELPFTIYPSGTFTRNGTFDNFSLDAGNAMVKLTGLFTNHGKLVADAQLSVEVYFDDEFQDVITSDSILVDPHGTSNMSVFYSLKKHGNYRFVGKIVYNKKETPSQELSYESKSRVLSFITGNVVGVYKVVQNSLSYILTFVLVFCLLFVIFRHVHRYS